MKELKMVFDQLDKNKDGSISRDELKSSLEGLLDCSSEAARKNVRQLIIDAGLNPDFYVFEQIDADGDGKITWGEFQAQLKPATDVMELLRIVFHRLDENSD